MTDSTSIPDGLLPVTQAEPNLASSSDILAAPIDQIRLAFDSLKQDRDRLKDAINTVRVNAIRNTEPEKLIDFLRTDFGSVTTGCTIGEAVIAWQGRADRISTQAPNDAVQPMATAPKDGTYYLVVGENFDGGAAVVHWDEGLDNWTLDNGKDPGIVLRGESGLCGWMPLPSIIGEALDISERLAALAKFEPVA